MQGRHLIYPILGINVDLTPNQSQTQCDCPTAPPLPTGSVDANITATIQHGGAWAASGGLTKSDPMALGISIIILALAKVGRRENFNYGATGRARGISNETLVSAGGILQILHLRHGPFACGFPFVKDPYGDSKAAAIRKGEQYYDCGCYIH